ncbi:extracellular solute-binding protein [Enterococcus sp. LJL98]
MGISLGLALLAFSGCGNKESSVEGEQKEQIATTGYPISDEQIKMTMMLPAGQVPYQENASAQALEELTNIKFDYIEVPDSDFYVKMQLAFASNDLPDILYGAGYHLKNIRQIEYGNQGLLLPLEDLIDEYAPNLVKVLEENPGIRESITSPDGHIYALPRIFPLEDSVPVYISPLWYNNDWLEALNVQELPKTTDELYQLLTDFKQHFKEKEGRDVIPFSGGNGMLVLRTWLLPAFNVKTQGIEEHDGIVRFSPATDDYLAYLTYMNQLFTDGLLDKEIFSQSYDTFSAKVQKGDVGLFEAFYSNGVTGKTIEESVKDPMFHPIKSELSKDFLTPGHPRLVSGAFAISKNNPNPAAAIRWVDYLYTKEGSDLINVGPEGDFWEFTENDSGEKVRVFTGNDSDKMEEARGRVALDYGFNAPGLQVDIKDDIRVDKNEESILKDFFFDEVREKILKYEEVPFPIMHLTEEENQKVADIMTDVNVLVEQAEAKFITGVEPLSNYKKYVETLEKMGIREVEEIYQNAYDRFANN